MLIAGIDLGTAAIKVVFIDEENRLLWSKVAPATFGNFKISEELLKEGLRALSIQKRELSGIATTGYGKRIFPAAEKKVDEITAIATAAYHLSNKTARTIVNIGGQDIKVIKIRSDGKTLDFRMNDKCAAGTGRFFEKAARILDTPINEFGNLEGKNLQAVSINSTCAVFVESEIASLLYKKAKKEDIISGIHQSIARRLSDLMRGLYIEQEIYLDGGPAQNNNLLFALQEEIMMDIKRLALPQLTAAIGAAMVLAKKKKGERD
ncbi:hypothetical protein KJA13_02765 [Patescibacteria group bacterium]|nr:hypothetical protein [Patescibacteria group bacterium]